MMRAFALLALLGSASAYADGPSVQADMKPLQDAVEALQAKTQPCAAPLADTLNGSVGSGPCLPTSTATRPTVVQAALATTGTDGTWSVTWLRAFQSATPYINAQPVNPSALQPVTCNVTSSTSAAASGKCWMQSVMTLPGVSVSLANLQLVGAAAAMQVRVAGRDLTQ